MTVTETDKMDWIPIDIGHCICLDKREHLHIIPYNPFFIDLGLCLCQCEHTLNWVVTFIKFEHNICPINVPVTVTETDTETGTNEMATIPSSTSVSVQYKHPHIILYQPFLSVWASVI